MTDADLSAAGYDIEQSWRGQRGHYLLPPRATAAAANDWRTVGVGTPRHDGQTVLSGAVRVRRNERKAQSEARCHARAVADWRREQPLCSCGCGELTNPPRASVMPRCRPGHQTGHGTTAERAAQTAARHRQSEARRRDRAAAAKALSYADRRVRMLGPER